ncbi:MAG: hypothetical protein JKY65_12455 [Planctomycetes bacterium]|nr:hypothetical protein [Planctomycetota bacterium]
MRILLSFLLIASICSLAVAEDEKGFIEVLGPPGIQVYLDGRLQGVTSSELKGYIIQDVTPGHHVLRASKAGFLNQEEKIQVVGGEVVSWRVKVLKRKIRIIDRGAPKELKAEAKVGGLKIWSVPTTCEFRCKSLGLSSYKKTTPETELADVPVGRHEFSFAGMGKTLTKVVEVRQDEVMTVMVNFPRGTVTVKTEAPLPPVKLALAFRGRIDKAPLAREGGSQGTEKAVEAALGWLKRAQSEDGKWDSDGWRDLENHPRNGHNAGDGRYDPGVTSLALLAFLGNGQSPRSGTFKRTVSRGLAWLKRRQKANGAISFEGGETIYNHAISTTALCEAYALTGDPELKRYAEKAIAFCLKAQNPNLGWQYGVKTGKNDTSVTGWMILALKAGKAAGLEVPEKAFIGARRWLTRATASNGGVGYALPGGGSSYLSANEGKYDPVPCMTGVSVLCRILSGERRSDDAIRKGTRILSDARPTWKKGRREKVNFYYWYYGTNAMFQNGGNKWKEWNKDMQAALLPNQCVGGPEDGSWPPVGEWSLAGGRVYATAMNALTLETYYRYARVHTH